MKNILSLYDRFVLGRPAVVLALLLLLVAFFGYWSTGFRLDASADSLILENDDDLRFARELGARYSTGEFLIMTYTPQGDLFSDGVLERLGRLRDELKKLERVSSVVSLLDVPLFRSPPVSLKDVRSGLHTLESPETDRSLVPGEFRDSPLFQNLLVSPDLKSTALQINFERDPQWEEILTKRAALKDKEYKGTMTPDERAQLKVVMARYRAAQDERKAQRHEDIAAIRGVMDGYRSTARLFLGGVPMVVDDMISFIKRDLRVFGLGMLVFLVLMLGIIFRRVRWVALPLLCCVFSVVVMVGILGLVGWEVTVISSNFISLQLIITMSFTIHLIVRYRELASAQPGWSQGELVRETVRTIFVPCFFSCLTTIAGFSSLVICDILPVINFGWMMSMGLAVSLVVTFWFFPAALRLLPRVSSGEEWQFGRPITSFFARLTERRGPAIITLGVVIAAVTLAGIFRLEVENSFINYFKQSTEIYQGMKVIDQELGGTTPLDVVLRFDGKGEPAAVEVTEAAEDDADFAMFEEFEEAETGEAYWFTTDKLLRVERVHDYLESLPATGKVLSLATLLKMTRQITEGKALDNFDLALMFGELPDRFKKIIVDPFVSVENNEARIFIRIKDSLPTLRRREFLAQIQSDLEEKLGLEKKEFRLAGLMILYNNMLQSLFQSQVQTIGLTVIILLGMFMALFRSLKIALIAIFPNLLSSLVVLGFMGLKGIPLDMMTITIVAISVGIAVDNTIHYIFRFRREVQKDGDYVQTMHRCHGSIGNAMYYTSTTIVLGFSILALSNFIPSILFGLLTALAMVMALGAALTLLPRLIILFKPFGKVQPL